MDDLARIPTASCPKVFVCRDYCQGLAVKFLTKFPVELEGRIDCEMYQDTINKINAVYADAESLSRRTYCESCLACLTAYLSYLCVDTYYEKCIKKVTRYIESQNKTVYIPRGLMLVDPAERGLRVIEIAVLQDTIQESVIR